MTCAECRERLTHSYIKVEEGPKKATFLNPGRVAYFRTTVDGCIVRNAVAADFVVSKIAVGDVVVELKGKDVDHAVEQITATAELLSRCQSKRGPLAGLVVCAQYPRLDSKIQRLANAFTKRFGGPLHVVTKSDEFVFEKVLSFSGPR